MKSKINKGNDAKKNKEKMFLKMNFKKRERKNKYKKAFMQKGKK